MEVVEMGFAVALMVMWLVLYGARLIARESAQPAPVRIDRREPYGRSTTDASSTRADADQAIGLPPGVRLDDYIRSGLQDLRIMLIQQSRRRE